LLAWLAFRPAALPGSALGIAGIALLVARPSPAALDALDWMWPVAAAALAGWIGVRAGRALDCVAGRGPVLLGAALLGLAAVGGGYQAVGAAFDRSAHPPPGRLVDVGGHRLHLYCTGTGSPTVVLEALSGGATPLWGWIQPGIAEHTRVCSYDRAGHGWSDPVDHPQDGAEIATDLDTLLNRAGEAGPYVLVGHSIGGLYARMFAERRPDLVAGMVLLDATHPDAFVRAPGELKNFIDYRDMQSSFSALARLGMWRAYFDIGGELDFAGLPAQQRADLAALWSDSALHAGQRDENATGLTTREQARTLRDLGALPLAVVTAGSPDGGWRALQDDLATLSTHSVHRVVAGATHLSLVTNHENARLVTDQVIAVVNAARTGRPLD
jgi:pimeloyl-ACP methyl ester carboxylesterase